MDLHVKHKILSSVINILNYTSLRFIKSDPGNNDEEQGRKRETLPNGWKIKFVKLS